MYSNNGCGRCGWRDYDNDDDAIELLSKNCECLETSRYLNIYNTNYDGGCTIWSTEYLRRNIILSISIIVIYIYCLLNACNLTQWRITKSVRMFVCDLLYSRATSSVLFFDRKCVRSSSPHFFSNQHYSRDLTRA